MCYEVFLGPWQDACLALYFEKHSSQINISNDPTERHSQKTICMATEEFQKCKL